MGWQVSSEMLPIKARVRHRDGYRCAVCGIHNGVHEKRYGHILEVHRIVPRSSYSTTWGACLTLCLVCHDAVEGKGHWGWIAREDFDDDEDRAYSVRRSSMKDLGDERDWRVREAWGAWLRNLRVSTLGEFVGRPKPRSTLVKLAAKSDLPIKTLRAFEAGRQEPLLSEAKALAKALDVSLDELAKGHAPNDEWMAENRKQSDLRAVAFRARGIRDGEVLGRGAQLICSVVEKLAEGRAERRALTRKVQEMRLQEQQPVVLGRKIAQAKAKRVRQTQ